MILAMTLVTAMTMPLGDDFGYGDDYNCDSGDDECNCWAPLSLIYIYLFMYLLIYCGPPAMLEGPLSFHLSRCLYGCMYACMKQRTDVRSHQHQKVNLRSLMRMQ